MDPDHILKTRIRADLPKEMFISRPRRALLAVPLIGFIIVDSMFVVRAPIPWYVSIWASLMLGAAYGSLMFFGHEISHGATVRSRWLQDILLYPAFSIFIMSPHVWRVWHQRVHHAFTNMEGRDPDNFGTLSEFHEAPAAAKFRLKFSPGSGHWFSG